MNIVVEKHPKCVATLRVEIPAERVYNQREQIVRGYASKARVTGFRPGKAPRAVVEKRFHKEILAELSDFLINEAYEQTLKQESLSIMDFGAPQAVTTHADGSLTFTSQLTLAPEVALPDYKGISVIVPPLAVPAEAIETQLTALQERFADFNDITDRAAEMGDFAVIDYSSTVDGKSVEEFLGKPAEYLSGRENFWVRLDGKSFIPSFTVQLLGIKPGDSKEITVILPDDFPVTELVSKELVFQVFVKELKAAVLPTLDDEFAGKIAPGKTLEELKALIDENLATERGRLINDMKVNQIIAHFDSHVAFDLPEDLVARETQNQADALVKRGVQAGMTEGEIESQQNEIFATAGAQAVSNLRTNFILQEIARVENITVEDAELVHHLVQVANSRKVLPKKFIKDLQRANRISGIRSSILVGKTIDFIVEHANLTEEITKSLDV